MAKGLNNFSILPIYESLEQQDFRLWYAYGERYQLYVPKNYLIPFYFILPVGVTVTDAEFYQPCCDEIRIDGNSSYNSDFSDGWSKVDSSILGLLRRNGFTVISKTTYNIATYFAAPFNAFTIEEGFYYIKFYLSDGSVRYTDVFYAKNDISDYLKLEWYNENSLLYEGGEVPYSEHFDNNGAQYYYKSRVYIAATIGRPEYKFEEEGEERDGYFFAIKQISEKTYHFNFYAPEFLCDAMRLARMADRLKIIQYAKEYDCDTFSVETDWLEHGHYASVSCEFDTDTVVKLTGKAYSTFNDR